ncbi:CPBP family intramembrane glutamic endopeptidase [Alkalibacterium sp. 20]|uniref:CPBP family intramembrane glutamic endopeptidase n=1 Tax=Alkalibacterium sp. 20 TaxID=1798803 RepID=UPI000900025F|nr:CPBP family intramembrane glutamic endopeptidase [Alkalibacterium sp. 20]OJF91684.1 hypothetical protein AX762_10895 [Alkalibacterium sp. 20]
MDFKIKGITRKIIITIATLIILVFFFIILPNNGDYGEYLSLYIQIIIYLLISVVICSQFSREDNHHRLSYLVGNFDLKDGSWLKWGGYSICLIIFGYVTVISISNIIISDVYEFFILTPDTEQFHTTVYNLLAISISVLFAPIAEELYFRGYLMNKLGASKGLIIGVIFNSFIFSILHLDSFFIPQFLSGIFYSLVYIKTKKIIIPIVLHSFHNLINFIVLFFPYTLVQPVGMPSRKGIEAVFDIGTILFLIILPVAAYFAYTKVKNLNDKTPYQWNKERQQEVVN